MTLQKLTGLALALGFVSICHADRALILEVNKSNKVLPSTPLGDTLASILAEEFTLEPVVWSMTDPVFRQATYDGVIKVDIEKSTLDQARAVCKPLAADYLMVIETGTANGTYFAGLKIYRGGTGRPIYQKSLTAGTIEGVASAAADRQTSIARTWLTELKTNQFKDYVKLDGGGTGAEGQGVKIITEPPPPIESEQDSVSAAKRLMDNKDYAAAVIQLQDAIDRNPGSMNLRLMLIRSLEALGSHGGAMSEVQRALVIDPANLDLRIYYLQSLLGDQNLDAADDALNELMARAAMEPRVMALAGQLAHLRQRFDLARSNYLQALAKGPSGEIQVLFAFTLAAQGDAAEITHSLTLIKSEDIPPLNQLFQLDRASVQAVAKDLRDIIPAVRLQNQRQAMIVKAQDLLKKTGAMVSLIEALPFTEADKVQVNKLLLAHKLLHQAAGEVLDFAQSGDEDLGAEAQLNLGEAVRRFEQAIS